MPGPVDHSELEAQRFDARGRTAGHALDGDRHALARRTERARSGRRDKLRDTADVIGMVMRRKDGLEAKALGRECRHHRRGVAGIDDGDGARILRAADQPDVVVLEGGDGPHVEHARV